jgi:hypothetical protein
MQQFAPRRDGLPVIRPECRQGVGSRSISRHIGTYTNGSPTSELAILCSLNEAVAAYRRFGHRGDRNSRIAIRLIRLALRDPSALIKRSSPASRAAARSRTN